MGGRGSSSAGGKAATGQTRTKAFTSSSGSEKKQVKETDKMFTALGTKKSK